MRASARAACSRTAVVSLLTLAAVAAHTAAPRAQAAGQRWDGLLEDITVSSGFFAPMPPPANGPSQLPRHAVSADGRYVLFTSQATNLAGFSSGYAVYLRYGHTFEARLLLAGAALDPVLSADGNHVAFQVCDPYGHMEGPREI